ncbi:MAG: hypothetical protein JNJ57_18335 [Saprospiraceae bacterium]|nr:hypothetical protein [Saprospiraceae bacterium]
MHNLTERNERSTRTHALVLAIGLHLSLGFLLYTQMDTKSTTKYHPPAKEKSTGPVAQTVSRP